MGSYNKFAFDQSFKPNPLQLNAIMGLIVGLHEAEFTDGWAGWRFQIRGDWAADNIPNVDERLGELEAAGWVYIYEWAEGDQSVGLTEGAILWAEQNLGLPAAPEDGNYPTPAVQAFAATVTFNRKINREAAVTSKGVKTTTKMVTQTSYTHPEAVAAIEKLVDAVNRREITVGSYRAYKAHITRRIA